MKPLIVITGPTASGKTAMSIEMAQKLGGEIINADSMQVYKYMDVGTAKPDMEERAGIPHHLIDVIEPTDSFSAAQYTQMAHRCIAEVHGKGKIPILVGGTGLYIDSVVYNINYGDSSADEALRRRLNGMADDMGNEHLHKMLAEIDPQSAEKIHPSDRKRIVRALEVYYHTGETMTEQKRKSRSEGIPYSAELYAIDTDRALLYERINKRVDIMLESGLIDEVKRLTDMGVNREMTSMQGIGYKELIRYLDGEISIDTAIGMIKQGSRRYAKRQLTWFRRNHDIIWIRR